MTRPRYLASVAFSGTLLCLSLHFLAPRLVGVALVDSRRSAGLPRSRLSTSFVLEKGRWLHFRVPPGQETLKLVTNANVATQEYHENDLGCTYTLEYVLVGRDGKPLKERFYSLRGSTSTYRDPISGETAPSRFYLGSGLSPLGTRTVFVKVGALAAEVERLDIRLADADPAVVDISLRAYYKEQIPRYKLATRWARTGKRKRRRLARGNVYGVSLLSKEEKLNLLANRWSALAPRGIDEQDYNSRKIYTQRGRLATGKKERILPYGLYLDARTVGALKVEEEETCLRLEFYRAEAFDEQSATDVAHVSWRGRDDAIRVEEVPLGGAVTRYESEWGIGVLEIEAACELVVRAFLPDGVSTVDITPRRVSVPGYLLGDGKPVEFYSRSTIDRPRVLRIDVRRMSEKTEVREAAKLRYELLDPAGKVLESGEWQHDAAWTPYDMLVGERRGFALSEASRSFFWIPPGCERMRLTSGCGEVLVSAYTRVSGLPRSVGVRGAGAAALDSLPRDWFGVKPENYSDFVVAGREIFVRRQQASRAPWWVEGEDPVDHRLIDPEGLVTGKRILTPEAKPLKRAQALVGSRYLAVPSDTTLDLEFDTVRKGSAVPCRLLCMSPRGEPFNIAVRLDGDIVLRRSFSGSTARATIDGILPGRHSLTVDRPDGVAVYVNSVASIDGAWVLERTVYELGVRGLTYHVRKKTTGRETLSFRLFEHPGEPRPRRLRVTVLPVERSRRRSEAWTYPVVLVHVPPQTTGWYPLLWSRGEAMTGGAVGTVVLGDDLDPGVYTVRVTVEEGDHCYVQLSHGLVASGDEQEVFIERGAMR